MGAVPGWTLVRHTRFPPDVSASEDFLATAHGGSRHPPPFAAKAVHVIDKQALRTELRERRRQHAAEIPDSMRGLLFLRPPTGLLDLVPEGATVGAYYPVPGEASPLGYARWLAERGHRVALPWFTARGAPMRFKSWDNPFSDDELVADPYGSLQSGHASEDLSIDVALVPLLGFTVQGMRLGQGGGHYDRYLADNPQVTAIGLGWDCQLVDALPIEPHDIALRAVVTPTRFYGPF